MKKAILQSILLATLCIQASASSASFAIFYNDQDAAVIAGTLQRNDLTKEESQFAQKIWNGGMKGWATAVPVLGPCDDPTLPFDGKRIVIDAQGVNKQDMVNLLYSIATHVGLPQPGGYLTALAADLAQCAVEPAN